MGLLKNITKAVIRELYWTYAYDEDEHNERFVLAYADPNNPNDVVLAELHEAVARQGIDPSRIIHPKRYRR